MRRRRPVPGRWTDAGLLDGIGRTTRYRRWGRRGGCRVVGPMPVCRAVSVEQAGIGRGGSLAGPPGGVRVPLDGSTGSGAVIVSGVRTGGGDLGQGICCPRSRFGVQGPDNLPEIRPARVKSPGCLPWKAFGRPRRNPLNLWPYFSAAPGVAASFPGRGEVCQGSNLFEPEGPRSALDSPHRD